MIPCNSILYTCLPGKRKGGFGAGVLGTVFLAAAPRGQPLPVLCQRSGRVFSSLTSLSSTIYGGDYHIWGLEQRKRPLYSITTGQRLKTFFKARQTASWDQAGTLQGPGLTSCPEPMPRWITQMLPGIHFVRQLMSWYQCIFPPTFNNLNLPDQTFIRDFIGFVSKTLNSIISW